MNSPFHPVHFKVWLCRIPCFVAALPNDKTDPCFPSHPLGSGGMRSGYFRWWWQSRIERIKHSSSQRFGFFPDLHLLQPYVTSINIGCKSGKNWFLVFSSGCTTDWCALTPVSVNVSCYMHMNPHMATGLLDFLMFLGYHYIFYFGHCKNISRMQFWIAIEHNIFLHMFIKHKLYQSCIVSHCNHSRLSK